MITDGLEMFTILLVVGRPAPAHHTHTPRDQMSNTNNNQQQRQQQRCNEAISNQISFGLLTSTGACARACGDMIFTQRPIRAIMPRSTSSYPLIYLLCVTRVRCFHERQHDNNDTNSNTRACDCACHYYLLVI